MPDTRYVFGLVSGLPPEDKIEAHSFDKCSRVAVPGDERERIARSFVSLAAEDDCVENIQDLPAGPRFFLCRECQRRRLEIVFA
jgi:hypothetical protein